MVYGCDFPEVWTGEEGLSQCHAIKDLYDGSIVAYHISQHNDNPLVMENLRKAMEANPGATPLIHSDRGSQYTSREYRMVTTQY